MAPPQPERLAATFVEKIWGSPRLAPWFPDSDRKIGEVWFHRPELPLLIKFLFTSDKLSVQVHPGGPAGKTEMWHILRAEPGASIALGPQAPISREELQKAVASGKVKELLNWIPVAAGETYFVPAGTIHAIGAGIALCEIQQNCDTTFRLFDYERGRELHIDQALSAAHFDPHPGKADGSVICDYFCVEPMTFDAPSCHQPREWELLAIVEGQGLYGEEQFRAGEVWYIPAGAPSAWIRPEGRAAILRAWLPVGA